MKQNETRISDDLIRILFWGTSIDERNLIIKSFKEENNIKRNDDSYKFNLKLEPSPKQSHNRSNTNQLEVEKWEDVELFTTFSRKIKVEKNRIHSMNNFSKFDLSLINYDSLEDSHKESILKKSNYILLFLDPTAFLKNSEELSELEELIIEVGKATNIPYGNSNLTKKEYLNNLALFIRKLQYVSNENYLEVLVCIKNLKTTFEKMSFEDLNNIFSEDMQALLSDINFLDKKNKNNLKENVYPINLYEYFDKNLYRSYSRSNQNLYF